MIRLLRAAAAAALLVCLPGSARATDYYVSGGGSDANSGTATSSPWRTLAPANATSFQPGDRLLLRGGDTFDGTLSFDAADAGTATSPVVVTSYGTGRATLRATSGGGISALNAAGFRISDLNIVGQGTFDSGILFYTDLPGGVKLASIRIEFVDVSGFGKDGIEVGAWNGTTGFRDVVINGVSAHDNARTGILVYAQQPNVHQSVYVGYSRAFNNPGIAAASTNTGNGIVLGSVDAGTIERSVAHDNGRLCATVDGPVGIWTYDSRRVVIQQNESYNNRTGGIADGGGFDLDQNVSESVLQYNYSHGNHGAGYLLAHSPMNDGHHDNVVRFNISEDDGRRNSYAAIEVWGRTIRADIYHNTVFVSPAASGSPRAIRVGNGGIPDRILSALHVRNNIFVTSGGLPVIEVSNTQSTAPDLRFEGNDYYATGAPLTIRWGASTYTTLGGWRSTGQETIAGVAAGFSVDPQLTAAGAGGTLDDASKLETLSAYRLADGSPLVDGGLDLRTRFAVNTGTRDYFGAALPQRNTFDVGAGELPPVSATPGEIVLRASSATTVGGNWRRVVDPSAAGGTRLWLPDAGAAKPANASASPLHYFELDFDARAGVPYRLWLRLAAEANSWSNDSVFVQFSGAVTDTGSPTARIGTTSSSVVNLEDCSGCGVSGWGWQDNGYGAGVLGPLVYFAADGLQRIRIQGREDGVSIDQIVLSPSAYLVQSPGALQNDSAILPSGTTAAPPLEIVRYAADVATTAIHGDWVRVQDASAAAGLALRIPDRGAAKVPAALASPSNYVDVTFNADANTDYHVWVRLKADGNSPANDSIYLQFSDAVDDTGTAVNRIGTSNAAIVVLQDYTGAAISGWGWNDDGWAGLGGAVRFGASGIHTLRIQQREDGVSFDQLVISAGKYLTASPGRLTNDVTILSSR